MLAMPTLELLQEVVAPPQRIANPFPQFPDWTKRDYTAVFAWRQAQILAVRKNPALAVGAIEYYRTRRAEFIEHWCSTYDPRNAGTDKLTTMPFVMFKRQREFVAFLDQCLALENNGLVEKARDMGATWISCAYSVHLWRFLDGAAVGWGSRKQELVDELGVTDSIMEKIRMVIRNLPRFFWPKGFSPDDHMPFMRIINPETGATITGEVGDNIGRGGRKLIYFKDESAHYARPEKIEAALGDTTRVQIDISSVNGLNNVFHRKRENGQDWNPFVPMNPDKTAVFVMDWRDHPEKSEAWYQKRKAKYAGDGLSHIFAQEVDRDYAASVTGTIIKLEWIRAAIDAHVKLDFDDSGPWVGALDVADEGMDINADAFRKGPILKKSDAWEKGDTGKTARRFVEDARSIGAAMDLMYDCIGVGAGVKAETNRLREVKQLPVSLRLVAWAASAKVLYPKQRLIRGDKQSRLNEDFFQNLKAQAWWELARRFERTWRAIVEGIEYDPGELISLPSDLPGLRQIEKELAQAVFTQSAATMKTMVDKTPDGTRSPNRADAIVMAYWPIQSKLPYTGKALG